MRHFPSPARRRTLLALVATGSVLVLTLRIARPAVAATSSASIVDFAFSPGSISVHTGDTVIWTNTGQATHTVTADAGGFDSGQLSPGATFSFRFAAAGSYTYHCNIHAQMHGTIVVTAAAAPAAAAPTAAAPAAAAPANAPAAASATAVVPAGTRPVSAQALPATGSGGPISSRSPLLAAVAALSLAAAGGALRLRARNR